MSVSEWSRRSALLVCLVLVGCAGGDTANRKPTTPVTVTVTYNGEPVDGATVTFIDDAGQSPAFGRTDSQGKAKMKTYEEGDGAVAGTHKVTINKAEVSGDDAADQDTEAYVPPDENTPGPTITNLIPVKYGSPGSSGLTAEISGSAPIELKFELTDEETPETPSEN